MAAGSVARRRIGARPVALAAIVVLGLAAAGAYFLYLHRDDNPGCQSAQRTSSCTRVFFIGNSYTSVNDLPTMFGDLAWSGGHRVETGVQAPGGWSLADHAGSKDTAKALDAKPWDLVVLQEQSQIPSVESSRQGLMFPAARTLVTLIRDAGARPVFFVTWAHRDGWPENGMPNYQSMQASIDTGYLRIAAEQRAGVAPVGFAWMALAGQASVPELWQGDGSHPTTTGTYLAACVFYAAIFDRSPVGLGYHADLSEHAAERVQETAATTVLDDLARWGLT